MLCLTYQCACCCHIIDALPPLLQLLSRAQLAKFCPETLVVASKYCQDFEKYGIHLTSSSQRAEVARLLALNQHYPARFNAALVRGVACALWGLLCAAPLPLSACQPSGVCYRC